MKLFALIFVSFFGPPVLTADHLCVRNEFQKASIDEASVNKILLICNSKSLQPLLSEVYFAAATLCSAKYKFSPLSKYETFNKVVGS